MLLNETSSRKQVMSFGAVSAKQMLATAAALVIALLDFMRAPVFAAATEVTPTSVAQSVGYTDHNVLANGVNLHFITGGKGEPVLLLPGWPENAYAWRAVMKLLILQGRMVYALDYRGIGDSQKPATGYDLATAAEDVHAFIQATGLSRPGGIDIVSHDVGSWVAYAHASAHPEDIRRLVLTEAAIPGTSGPAPTPTDEQNVKSWHFGFNRLNDLPEILVQGHERAYLTWLFATKGTKTWTIDSTTFDEYLSEFLKPGTARVWFDYYREAFNASGIAQMKVWISHKLAMPVFTLSGDGSIGPRMLTSIQPYATTVTGKVLVGCGHFLPDECPEEMTKAVTEFWRVTPVSPAAH